MDLCEGLIHDNDKGLAIAICVSKTDGKGRKSENVTGVRAIWHDHDDDKQALPDFPIPPSVTVQTSPGKYHSYWRVLGDWPADEVGRNDFSRVMKGMVESHGSDPNVTDICRVMRLTR